jgi:hypothetical protein
MTLEQYFLELKLPWVCPSISYAERPIVYHVLKVYIWAVNTIIDYKPTLK